MTGLPRANLRAMAQRELRVEIKRVRLDFEHLVDVFPIIIENLCGVWHHTCTSESELKTFLEGLRVGVEMLGGKLNIPELPSRVDFEMVELNKT